MGSDTYCWSVRKGGPRRKPRRFAPRTYFQLRILVRGKTVVSWFSPNRGYAPFSITRSSGASGGATLYFAPVMETRVKKRTPQATQGAGPVHLAAMETIIFDRVPNITAHCATVRYEDGTPRQPGWITIRTLGGAWQVTAKEPDACCQLVSVAQTLDDALAQLDLLLGADEAPWELDPWAKRKGGQVDKKKA